MGITYGDTDVDTDETTIQLAALTPTDNGVIIGNGAAFVVESGATLKTSLGLTIGTDVQAYAANLTSWAAVAPGSYLTTAAAAAAYQPLDADLTAWAGVTRASGFDTFAATPSGANLASLLTTALPVSKGGTNATAAGIAAFNNITGYTAAGATGTTSTNIVFSTSPTITTPVLSGTSSVAALTLAASAAPNGPSIFNNSGTHIKMACGSSGLQINNSSNSVTLVEILDAGGMIIGAPTGGNKGAGTLNATAVYDDNTLLTCYIVEHWKYGSIDLAKWDAIATGELTEQRQHAPARGFAAVAANRLDIDKFSQFVWDNERLPAFPAPDRWADMYAGKMSTGDLIQRLWETVEVMAIHSIEARKRELALIARVEALEAAQ